MRALVHRVVLAALAALFCVAAVGCNQAQRLSSLQIGMSEAQAASVIGSRYTVRGAIQNKYGQSVKVWEVVLSQPKTGREVAGGVTLTVLTFGFAAPVLAMPGKEKPYWLYFVDGRLVRWVRRVIGDARLTAFMRSGSDQPKV